MRSSGGRRRGDLTLQKGRARAILNGVEAFVPLSADDAAFVLSLLSRHPDAAQKVGAGIAHVEVRPDGWGGRCFWAVRVDGSATDFSYLSCLRAPRPIDDFAKACRRAVVDQVGAFKEAAFAGRPSLVCPVSGEVVTPDSCHVDHGPPWTFDELVRAFAAGRDLAAEIEPTRDGQTVTQFRSPETWRAFADFHRERASLRVVSRRANLSLLRRRPKDR